VVRCKVPDVTGDKLSDAKDAIAKRHCSTGKVSRVHSRKVKAGHVISQHPDPGTILRRGGAVDLLVSKGRKT
jgi:eukaryotic-like serine/threonine-protein kinase